MSLGRMPTASDALAADARTLGKLKAQTAQNTPEGIKEAAKQFESLFMRELLKSMREATMKSGLMDSPGGDLGADLLDQQFAVQMSGQPGGLSELIAKQLSRQMGEPDAAASPPMPATPAAKATVSGSAAAAYNAQAIAPASASSNFVKRHGEAADRIAKATGLPAGFMLGQAGHETGWGKHEIKQKDGSPSFNLFGIKAGPSWTGKVAEVTTTEYTNGVAKKTVAKFRAYDSYDESFRDYARLITETPRYAQAKQQTSSPLAFASGLQRAGYATDPDYANKLSRAINTSLRLQRAQA
ncbi:MAG: flagellar assembly peptidoglycan hydrolase FlgJ [Betaproteobacteria bacterium]|jgi:flagellar protein FlgJ